MKQKNSNYLKLTKFILLGVTLCIFSEWVVAESEIAFSDVADNLFVGTSAVTKLIHVVCISVGIALFVTAFSLFKAHQFNPKFVPLERPIIYVLLGIILIAIPFFGDFFGPTGSIQDYDKAHTQQNPASYDIDAPIEWGNDFDH